MAIKLQKLISIVSSGAPSRPLFEKPSTETPEEVNAAFDALDGIFTFNRFQNGLMVNEAVQLTEAETNFANKIVASFADNLRKGNLRFLRADNGVFVPATIEKEREGKGVRFLTQSHTLQQGGNPVLLAAGGCTWQWWLKVRWWGVRVSLNHCAVEWVTSGASGLAAALAAFGLPAIASAVLGLAVGILKFFDKGLGVRIYFLWTGQFWVTSKPA